MSPSKASQRSVTQTFATLALSPFFMPGDSYLSRTLKHLERPRNQRWVKGQPRWITVAISVAFVLWGVLYTENFTNTTQTIVGGITSGLGWLYMLITTFFLVFVIYPAFSRYGKIKLGQLDDDADALLDAGINEAVDHAGGGGVLREAGRWLGRAHYTSESASGGLHRRWGRVRRGHLAAWYKRYDWTMAGRVANVAGATATVELGQSKGFEPGSRSFVWPPRLRRARLRG